MLKRAILWNIFDICVIIYTNIVPEYIEQKDKLSVLYLQCMQEKQL